MSDADEQHERPEDDHRGQYHGQNRFRGHPDRHDVEPADPDGDNRDEGYDRTDFVELGHHAARLHGGIRKNIEECDHGQDAILIT